MAIDKPARSSNHQQHLMPPSASWLTDVTSSLNISPTTIHKKHLLQRKQLHLKHHRIKNLSNPTGATTPTRACIRTMATHPTHNNTTTTHHLTQLPPSLPPLPNPFADQQYSYLGKTIPSYRTVHQNAGLCPTHARRSRPRHHHHHSPARFSGNNNDTANNNNNKMTTTISPASSTRGGRAKRHHKRKLLCREAKARGQMLKSLTGATRWSPTTQTKPLKVAGWKELERRARCNNAQHQQQQQHAQKWEQVLAETMDEEEENKQNGMPCYCLLQEKLELDRVEGY